jgi:hypothetical protein
MWSLINHPSSNYCNRYIQASLWCLVKIIFSFVLQILQPGWKYPCLFSSSNNILQKQLGEPKKSQQVEASNTKVIQKTSIQQDVLPTLPQEPIIREVHETAGSGRLGFGSLSLTAYELHQKKLYLDNRAQTKLLTAVPVVANKVSFTNLLHKEKEPEPTTAQSVLDSEEEASGV